MTPSVARSGSPARPAHGRRLRALEAVVLAAIGAGVFGCLTFDSTLKPDGSGTFEMTYQLRPGATVDAEKKRHSSPNVTVDSLVFKDAKTAVVKGHVDDATKISTAEAFKDVTVTRTRDGDDERLVIKVKNSNPRTIKDEGLPGPKISIDLPGAVREANHDAKVDGSRVTWSFTLAQWMQAPSTEMTVRYAAPKAAADKDKAPAH